MIHHFHNDISPLTIPAGQSWFVVDSFGSVTGERIISLEDGAQLHYLAICQAHCTLTIKCHCTGKGGKAFLHALCLGTQDSDIHLVFHTFLQANDAEANVHLLSLLRDGSKCSIDGGIMIEADVAKVSGHLLEETILLEENVRLKTIPRLDVKSSDVRASHGAKIDKLDDKKLFYLTSKGIAKPAAKQLMIEGYFNTLFDPFIEHDAQIGALKESSLHRLLDA